MMRFGYFSGAAKIGVALALALATGYAFAAAVSIANTKHNLSSGSTATIKALAGGTDSGQICVFCHTPHNANTSQPLPLWNKQLSVATYTTYTSDYLTALGYPGAAAFTPGQSSRVCLSCHDGTVAIGAVYNLNGTASPGIITMNTAGSLMPNTAGTVGYLGTNLVDDHPVGYEYRSGGAYPPVPGQITDPQLKTYGAAGAVGNAAVAVNLDPKLSTGKVECKSCHDPHKGDFGKFLVETNVNAALCKRCHDKGDIAIPANSYDASGHNTSTQAFNKNGGDVPLNRNTVGQWSCLACHSPHTNPGVTSGIPILKRAEETTCFEQGCHGALTNWGAGNTTVGSLNIQAEMPPNKAHGHPTNSVSGKHKDIPSGESQTQLGGIAAVNRHAECFDCHNPHQVQVVVGKSTRGALRISAALLGTWGVEPTWPTPPTTMTNNLVTFAVPAAYTKVSGATLTDEYQVCLKCHSNYVTLPASTRNLAAEINPKNSSYHGIVPITTPTFTGGNVQLSNATNFFVNSSTMVQPWAGTAVFVANTGTLAAPSVGSTEYLRQNPGTAPAAYASRGRVWCSDCHNNNAAPVYPSAKSATVASGPHGSTYAGTGYPSLVSGGQTGTGIPNSGTGPSASNSEKMLIRSLVPDANGVPLCVACHLGSVYNAGPTGAATPSRNTFSHQYSIGVRALLSCFSCHMYEDPFIASLTTTAVQNNNGGTGRLYPHGMNKRYATVGRTTAAGSLNMVDSFIAGAHANNDFATKTCTIVSGGNSCGSNRNGTY